jgi:hypothetical protein
MPKMLCRICGEWQAVELEVEVSRKGKRRAWFLRVCVDCWRVFETMMDQGASRVQQGLDFDPVNARGQNWWFM